MAINRNSTVQEVMEFLEGRGLGEITHKLEGNLELLSPKYLLRFLKRFVSQSCLSYKINESPLFSLLFLMKESDVDGESFMEMDLLDIHGLTPKFKLRKLLRLAWAEVTGMEFNPDGKKVPSENATIIDASSPSSDVTTPTTAQTPRPDNDLVVVEEAVSTPESCSLSTPSTAAITVVRRTSPRKRKQPEASPLSSASTATNKRVSLFKQVPSASKGANTYWLEKFEIPSKWESAVQAALDDGELSVEHKNALNRQLCTTIHAVTDKVTKMERDHIAVQLIKKYPCLKGKIGAGHSFWSKKMKDRFENLNKKRCKELRKRLQQEGVEVPKGKPGRKKKASHPAAVVPAIPEGITNETYEEQKITINSEWKKGKKDYNLLRGLMVSTYPMRRREVLTENVRVWKLLQDFPTFGNSSGSEIRAELGRILDEPEINKVIKERFVGGWRKKLLSALANSSNKDVMEILEQAEGVEYLDQEEVQNRCIMAGLPFLFLEKRKGAKSGIQSFWIRAKSDNSDEVLEELINSSTSPRLISTGDINSLSDLFLASEGMVVCRFKPPNILTAVVTLLGSYYSFNMEFPKGNAGSEKNVFLLLEHLLLGSASATLPLSVEHVLSDLLKA